MRTPLISRATGAINERASCLRETKAVSCQQPVARALGSSFSASSRCRLLDLTSDAFSRMQTTMIATGSFDHGMPFVFQNGLEPAASMPVGEQHLWTYHRWNRSRPPRAAYTRASKYSLQAEDLSDNALACFNMQASRTAMRHSNSIWASGPPINLGDAMPIVFPRRPYPLLLDLSGPIFGALVPLLENG